MFKFFYKFFFFYVSCGYHLVDRFFAANKWYLSWSIFICFGLDQVFYLSSLSSSFCSSSSLSCSALLLSRSTQFIYSLIHEVFFFTLINCVSEPIYLEFFLCYWEETSTCSISHICGSALWVLHNVDIPLQFRINCLLGYTNI